MEDARTQLAVEGRLKRTRLGLTRYPDLLTMTPGSPAQDRAMGKLHVEETPFHRHQWKSPESHIRQPPKQGTCARMGGCKGAFKTDRTWSLKYCAIDAADC